MSVGLQVNREILNALAYTLEYLEEEIDGLAIELSQYDSNGWESVMDSHIGASALILKKYLLWQENPTAIPEEESTWIKFCEEFNKKVSDYSDGRYFEVRKYLPDFCKRVCYMRTDLTDKLTYFQSVKTGKSHLLGFEDPNEKFPYYWDADTKDFRVKIQGEWWSSEVESMDFEFFDFD